MATTESGLQYKDIKVGEGPSPPVGFQVAANYVAMVPSGQIFDRSRTASKSKGESNAQESQKRHTSAGYGGICVVEGKTKKCGCPVMLYAAASLDGSVWTI